MRRSRRRRTPADGLSAATIAAGIALHGAGCVALDGRGGSAAEAEGPTTTRANRRGSTVGRHTALRRGALRTGDSGAAVWRCPSSAAKPGRRPSRATGRRLAVGREGAGAALGPGARRARGDRTPIGTDAAGAAVRPGASCTRGDRATIGTDGASATLRPRASRASSDRAPIGADGAQRARVGANGVGGDRGRVRPCATCATGHTTRVLATHRRRVDGRRDANGKGGALEGLLRGGSWRVGGREGCAADKG